MRKSITIDNFKRRGPAFLIDGTTDKDERVEINLQHNTGRDTMYINVNDVTIIRITSSNTIIVTDQRDI